MESLGSGNLPGSMGQSSDPGGYGKSWQRQASAEGAVRAADVTGFVYLSLFLCCFAGRRNLLIDAADRGSGVNHGFDSWGRDFIPKIPSRARALPCPGISSAQT